MASTSSSSSSESLEFRPKILVTHREVPKKGIDVLTDKCDVIFPPTVPPTRADILKLIKGVDGILWANHEALNAEALDAAGLQLKAISTMSAGLDYVDIPEIKKRGIPLGYTPMVLNDAVADIAIGLMIAAGRRFHEGRLKIDTNRWESRPQWMLGQDIKSSTVGIIGFGNIGQTIAQRLKGFNINTLLYTGRNRKMDAEEEFSAKFVPFDSLLSKSDYVFISVPLTKQTYHMINETTLSKMKPTSVLINIARGDIVDQKALVKALKNGTIFAAGLDVTTPEPLSVDDELLTLPNCGKN